MSLSPTLLGKLLGLAGATVVRVVRPTIDWRVVYHDPTMDTAHPRFQGGFVYAGWHEYMLMPIALRGDRRMVALASAHQDGQLVSRAMRHLGWGVAHGSTTRGGAAALLRLLRADGRNPNLTPDGPRGPRRRMALGPVFLASRLGLPLACVGYGYDRPWRARSWDRFAVPRPFSRARAVFGPPLPVPPNLDRDGLEAYRHWAEQLLSWLTEEAETWAASGRRRPGELAMLAGAAPPGLGRPSAAGAVVLPPWLARGLASLGHRVTSTRAA
jgi:lysophospholipid acyltransferase (LPLAT)-like uncharacterized protein